MPWRAPYTTSNISKWSSLLLSSLACIKNLYEKDKLTVDALTGKDFIELPLPQKERVISLFSSLRGSSFDLSLELQRSRAASNNMCHSHRPPLLSPLNLWGSSLITLSEIHFRNIIAREKKDRSYLDLMPGPNILLFVTNKISRTDSKFLICFSPSKMSALNYAERILLPANLFPFPVQNHPQNIVGGCL